jgi:hypothetical protein
MLLSLTVLTHRKLRQAGVEAYLQVFEGILIRDLVASGEEQTLIRASAEWLGSF